MEKLEYIKQNWVTLLEMAIVFSIPAAGVGFILSKYAKTGALEPVIVILVICAVCGVFNLPAMTVPVLILVALAISLTAWSTVFLFYCILALFSKRYRSKLTRFEAAKSMKSLVFFYEIEGNEYPCFIGGIKKAALEKNNSRYSKKYVIGNEYYVRYNKLFKRVFDKRAVMISLAGFMKGIIGASLFIVPMMFMEMLP